MRRNNSNKQNTIHRYISNAAYAMLCVSMSSLLILPSEKRSIPIIGLISAIILGYFGGRIKMPGIYALITYSLLLKYSFHTQQPFMKVMTTLSAVALNLAIGMHKLSGFNNQKIISAEIMSHHAVPYDLYLNFDKMSASIITFLLCGTYQSTAVTTPMNSTIQTSTFIGLSTILSTVVAALKIKFIQLDISVKKHFKLWLMNNLLFVCPSEEAMFRTLIQGSLEKVCDKRIALLFSSVLFGLAHYAGGKKYVALASIAGTGYGYAYQQTGAIKSSILIHFLLNLTHFLGFTYPALDELSALRR